MYRSKLLIVPVIDAPRLSEDKNDYFCVMKRLTLLLALALCQWAGAQNFGPINNLADVDRAARRLKADIMNAPSNYSATRNTYYVSQDGSDDNDGLSPQTPVKTLEMVNSMDLKRGDAVLFRRGDLWRGQLKTRPAVSYSAYGSGPKPRIYASPCNAAQTGKWTETDKPGVWAFSERYDKDAGTLVFDDGESGCAFKVLKKMDYEGNSFHIDTGKPFNSYKDLERDLDMYHDLSSGTIYLCSLKGNPAQRFKSIEILVHQHVVSISWGGNAIDNLCLKYSGGHGIHAAFKNLPYLKVTNCEIGWIGGSIQFDKPKPTSPGKFTNPTRYGNGIEIWGGFQSYVVDHNYIYQCYDAGITHQYSTKNPEINMDNIAYTNNLVEDCVYAIEYFYGIPDEFLGTCGMNTVLFSGNILRRSGTYSWGYQRPNKGAAASIKAWKSSANKASNFRIENNIIDRGDPALLDIHAAQPEWMPKCSGNIYIQQEGRSLGTEIEPGGRVIFLDEKVKAEPTPYTEPEPTTKPAPVADAPKPVQGSTPATESQKARIFLLGDSTCANSNPEISSQRGWGQVFHLFFKPDEVIVNNCAIGGTSSKTFRNLPHYKRVKKQWHEGDIVTIQFGINDGIESDDRFTTGEEFADSLRAFIADIRAAGARPVLLTPVVLRVFVWNGGLRADDNREMRAGIISKVGKAEKVPVIDCLSLTKQWLEPKGDEVSKNYYCYFAEGAYAGRFASGRMDNTHLNQAGAYEVAYLIAKKLTSTFPELKKSYVNAKYKDVVAEFGKIPYYSGN